MKLYLFFMITLLVSGRVTAWETDQFTLSNQPIAETGEEISHYVYSHLLESLKSAKQHRLTYADTVKNLSIELQKAKKLKRLRYTSSLSDLDDQIKQLQKRLDYYQQYSENYFQTPSGIASRIQHIIGSAIADQERQDAIWGTVTNLTPYEAGMKAQLPVKFYPSKFDSVYAYAGFHRVLHPSHFILSSTIKLYNIEIGMDKLGHLFNEGYQYYLLFEEAKINGDSDKVALEKAITWGVDTEDTYYGSWVSGIYSNADLASNYAGLHFYLNLFSPLTLDGVIYPPILEKDELGDYQVNNVPTNKAQVLLKRYISYHMNEALNPSSLEYLQYIVVEEAIKNRCHAWQNKYPDPTLLLTQSSNLTRWNGDEYGFDDNNTISILQSCFEGELYFDEKNGLRVANK